MTTEIEGGLLDWDERNAGAAPYDGDRSAPGDDLEIEELHLQRHRPASLARALAVAPDLVDQRLELRDHDVEFGEVVGKGVFGADRFSDSVGLHGPVVDAARDPVVISAGLAEVRVHEVERLVSHVQTGEDAERIELRSRRRTDAMKFSDRQRLNESQGLSLERS